jgi:hypothetical protein
MIHKYKFLDLISILFFSAGVSWLHAQSNQPKLVNVTQNVGVNFIHSMGDDDMSNLVESSIGGCALFDYDNDGDLDIYLTNGAYTETISNIRGRKNKGNLFNTLYRNNGDQSFSDVSQEAGVACEGLSVAVVTADYDNDGDQDIFVSNWGPNVFYRNDGNGTFTDITKSAGLGDDRAGIGCTFLDYDLDGFLDLYVGNYIEYDPDYQYFYAADKFPGPLSYHGQADILYHNNGDGTFSNVTKQAGVGNPDGRAMGVTSCDFDNDGDWDIFVANDAMENYLYRNNGDGTFTNVALQTATGFGQNGEATSAMSGEFGDINGDGLIDIIVPDMAYGCIYKNTGAGYFEEMSARMGLAASCGQYTSWSGNLFDFNNDGWLDLFISNGHPHRLIGEEDLMLLNVAGNRFENISDQLGDDFQKKFVGRGSAVGDYDNDGDMDILVLNLNNRPCLYRNDGGNQKNWLSIYLIGSKSNRDAIGSKIRLIMGDKSQTRWRVSSSGYLSQSDCRIHFGVGDNEQIDKVEIRWPTGKIQTLTNVKANQILEVKEVQ